MLGRLLAATAVVVALVSGPASAQGDYPNRPIRVVVPLAPGGGVDVMARLFSEKAAAALGVPVVVENRPGASSTIGGLAVRQSTPDGYTLLFAPITHVMANHVLKSVPYDPVADFVPIARVAEAPILMVTSVKMAPTSLSEVVAAARANPSQWTMGTSGLGGAGHIAMLALKKQINADVPIIPYRGTSAVLADLIGGHIQITIDSIITLLPAAREGKVKATVVTSPKRTQLAPDLPTTAEAGMPDVEFTAWYGFFGPKGVPADVVAKLNATMIVAGRQLQQEGRLAPLGCEPVAESAEQFSRFVDAQVDRSVKLLQGANFKPE